MIKLYVTAIHKAHKKVYEIAHKLKNKLQKLELMKLTLLNNKFELKIKKLKMYPHPSSTSNN